VYSNTPKASWFGNPFHDQSGFMVHHARNPVEWGAHVRIVHYRHMNGAWG